jgi:uncharacterized protein (DUF983 family)
MGRDLIWLGLSRGFRRRCPQCGQGPLPRRYLKVVSPCPVCGHDNGQYPADDAPPYFTILIVGHIAVAPMARPLAKTPAHPEHTTAITAGDGEQVVSARHNRSTYLSITDITIRL